MTTTKTVRTITLDELIRLDEQRAGQQEKPQQEETNKDLHEAKRENRFYLPVLHINHTEMWPSKPRSERRHFTDEVAKETCLSKCCGVEGLKSACCRMDPDDLEHVLGPLDEKWISKIIKWFKSRRINATRQDVVIDFEEGILIGRRFFNGHRVFEDPKSYPIMRFQVDGSHFACKFLNNATGMCNIYEQRPDMCRNYLCSYVKANFLVRTKDHPNQWKMTDPGSVKQDPGDDTNNDNTGETI